MIKVEVIEKFTLKEFNKIKNLQRKSVNKQGTLFVGDTFECDEEMVKYLTGGNDLKKVVVKVIEVLPTVRIDEEETKVIADEVNKTIKRASKKKKSKK